MEPHTIGSSLDNLLRVATAVQRIMTTVNAAKSEEEQTVAITKIVITLTTLNGH
jgi:hypothetical protein